jgi:hypothetical protein
MVGNPNTCSNYSCWTQAVGVQPQRHLSERSGFITSAAVFLFGQMWLEANISLDEDLFRQVDMAF